MCMHRNNESNVAQLDMRFPMCVAPEDMAKSSGLVMVQADRDVTGQVPCERSAQCMSCIK